MTREQILAMPAGRELDQLVALRIMGGTLCACGDPECGSWFPPESDVTDNADFLPHFGEDIKDAWIVVDKMALTHDFNMSRRNGGRYVAEFTIPSSEFVATEQTAPLAIVKAALLAKLNSEGKK